MVVSIHESNFLVKPLVKYTKKCIQVNLLKNDKFREFLILYNLIQLLLQVSYIKESASCWMGKKTLVKFFNQ